MNTLTPAGRLDARLAKGELPPTADRHYALLATANMPEDALARVIGDRADLHTLQEAGLAAREDRRTDVDRARHQYRGLMLDKVGTPAMICGLLGALVLGGPTLGPTMVLSGLASAAVAGLAGWWKVHRERQGTVTLNDGHSTHQSQWLMSPQNYAKSAEDMRVALTAEGVLGDHIDAHPRPELVGPQGSERMPELQLLDADRRLVAPLGHRSRYGRDVVDLVDADTAGKLLAAGRPVYALSVSEVRDVQHQLEATAQTPDRMRNHIESYHYTDRTVQYSLHDLRHGASPAGDGLPDGLNGVYADDTQYSTPIYRKAQSDTSARTDKSFSQQRTEFEQANARDVQRAPWSGIVSTWVLNLKVPAMFLGALVGEVVAMTVLPGVPGAVAVGLVAGGAGARALGGWLGHCRWGQHRAEKMASHRLNFD